LPQLHQTIISKRKKKKLKRSGTTLVDDFNLSIHLKALGRTTTQHRIMKGKKLKKKLYCPGGEHIGVQKKEEKTAAKAAKVKRSLTPTWAMGPSKINAGDWREESKKGLLGPAKK